MISFYSRKVSVSRRPADYRGERTWHWLIRSRGQPPASQRPPVKAPIRKLMPFGDCKGSAKLNSRPPFYQIWSFLAIEMCYRTLKHSWVLRIARFTCLRTIKLSKCLILLQSWCKMKRMAMVSAEMPSASGCGERDVENGFGPCGVRPWAIAC